MPKRIQKKNFRSLSVTSYNKLSTLSYKQETASFQRAGTQHAWQFFLTIHTCVTANNLENINLIPQGPTRVEIFSVSLGQHDCASPEAVRVIPTSTCPLFVHIPFG